MYRSTMVHGKKWIIQSFAKGWHILCVLKTWKMCQSLANHCILITNQGRCFSVVQPGDILNPYRCFGVISFLSLLNSYWKATLNDLQNWRIQNQIIWLHRLQRKYHVFFVGLSRASKRKATFIATYTKTSIRLCGKSYTGSLFDDSLNIHI